LFTQTVYAALGILGVNRHMKIFRLNWELKLANQCNCSKYSVAFSSLNVVFLLHTFCVLVEYCAVYESARVSKW